jgi:hypothetical protein
MLIGGAAQQALGAQLHEPLLGIWLPFLLTGPLNRTPAVHVPGSTSTAARNALYSPVGVAGGAPGFGFSR